MSEQRPHPAGPSRRGFITGSAAGVGAAGFGGAALAACSPDPRPPGDRREPVIAPGDTVLFQGDSITDAGRERDGAGRANDQAELGRGYAWLAAASLLVSRPNDDLRIYNRGVAGDRVRQLIERFDRDALDLQPNVISLLIGVNDIWHARNSASTATAKDYERELNGLLERTRDALPDVRLVICEPFLLPCGHVDETWFPEFDRYRAAARRIAEQSSAVFVPFHEMFERATTLAPPEHWAKDGIHPNAPGAALMSQEWLRVVSGGA